jgi:SAM-dependent methyltransferase
MPVPSGEPCVTACPVCLVTGPHDPYMVREMMFGSRETFQYLCCRACGTLRIAIVPGDLGRHYPERYHYGRLPDDVVPGSALTRWLVGLVVTPDFTGRGRRLARLARRLVVPPPGYRRWKGSLLRWGVRSLAGGVLDVGPGPAPDRLVVLHALGFRNLLGIDPFIAADLTVHGVRVRKQRIEEVSGRFDLVMFHHSFEHLPDPPASLRAAVALLRPGGRIVIRLPVMGSALWDRFGVDWWELDAPRHLFLFSRAGLLGLAESEGLRLVKVTEETSAKEFVGSEQYRRNLSMFEPGSWFVDPAASGFRSDEHAAFAEDARRANEAARAGRACFLFTKI